MACGDAALKRHDVYSGYLALNEKIDPEKYVLVDFSFEPAGDPRNDAQALAAESSIGTWTELTTMKPSIRKRLAARVFRLGKNRASVAYPLDIFELGSIPQFLSDAEGNIFGMSEISALRLLDIRFPRAYARSFKGPQLGLEGCRRIVGTQRSRRPHAGTIIKPKIGLGPREHAAVAYEAWAGGCDFVKDDENLTDQKFNPFKERVIRTLDALDKAESETGEKKIYAANITAETGEMLKRADFVKQHGGNCIMVDVFTAGFSALQTVRNRNYGMIIHGHRAMHAAFTRNKRHGISMLSLAKLLRLAGVDQLHTGAIVGKMEGNVREILEMNEWLRSDFYGLKPVLPVASGGVDPTRVPRLLDLAGTELVINAGGGIHGHPCGTRAGARALRQSMDAWMAGKSLRDYAKTHVELGQALEEWGNR